MRLIFVDDEPFVLDGLRRSLHAMRSEWSIEFANSGSEALEMMARGPFDVLVTDMRMPGMDGAQLLQEVKARYPHTIRIVLSGQASREALLRSITPSHQFLSKPCNVEELKEKIAKALLLSDLLENEAIKEVISCLSTVPSLPALYDEALKEIQSPYPSMARIGAIISKDLGMTAKILQLANSALLGVRAHISNATQAVSLIGMDMIRALIISAHIFSQFEQGQVQELDIPRLWQHSLATASVAQAIAKVEHAAKPTVEDCFTAGLLHDIGKLILMGSMPGKYRKTLAQVAADNISLLKAERETFNCTHPEVGAYLIGIWGLPHAIVEAVAWHHIPSVSGAKSFAPLTAVHVANYLVASAGFAHLGGESCLDQKHLEAIGLAAREPDWRQACQETIESMKSKEASL